MNTIDIGNKNDVESGCGCELPGVKEKDEAASAAEPRCVYTPAVDIVDGESETLLIADLPGVDEAGVDLTLENDTLTIRAKQAVPEFPGRKLIYSEYGIGEYRRGFSLSEAIDRAGISAVLKDGVLRVRLPKAVPVSKKITVASA